MRFTTNHDENSWNGTSVERLGGGVEAFNVLCALIPGMPLIYSGQEAGESKRLSFFNKDTIPWQDHPNEALFTTLLNEKKRNPALWNGANGGEFVPLISDSSSNIIAFMRIAKGHTVIVAINFDDKENTGILAERRIKGNLKNLFNGKTRSNKGLMEVRIKPYQYEVWLKE
jgi:1,4-alpha-glucan branching enzyme